MHMFVSIVMTHIIMNMYVIMQITVLMHIDAYSYDYDAYNYAYYCCSADYCHDAYCCMFIYYYCSDAYDIAYYCCSAD